MKFTIEEMNVLVRGLHLALEEARKQDHQHDTEYTNQYRALVSKLHYRVDDKLWKRIKKADDRYWAAQYLSDRHGDVRWGQSDDTNMMEPGADGMYDPIDETK